MRHRSWPIGLVALAQTALLATPATSALAQSTHQASPDRNKAAPADQKQISAPRRAIKWSQDKLSEMDATVVVLEQDATKARAEARPQAQAALARLRQTRDTYRAQARDAANHAETWTDNQVTSAQRSLDARWNEFETQRDNYLTTTRADLATRRAVLDARVQAWQKSIDELRQDAARLDANARADIDRRIAALQAQVDDAKARNGRLRDASRASWNTVKRNSAKAQQLFYETYISVRKSLDEAIRPKDQNKEKQQQR